MNYFQVKVLRQTYKVMCLGLIFLYGCQSSNDESYPDVKLETISILLDADANENSATSVDLLMVYDKALLKSLTSMNSKKYYANLNQIKRDYPELVDIFHWELTPGQAINDYPITMRSDTPFGAVMYADYFSPGDHRIRVGTEENIHVQLKRLDFCIIEQGCNNDQTGRTGFSEAIVDSLKHETPYELIYTNDAASCNQTCAEE